eukprot:13366191-Alexandrium_andersonii.AAC.1
MASLAILRTSAVSRPTRIPPARSVGCRWTTIANLATPLARLAIASSIRASCSLKACVLLGGGGPLRFA